MAGRTVELSEDFHRDLRKIVRRHTRVESIVLKTLEEVAKTGPAPTHHRLARLGGCPIYKARLPTGSRGTRGGARLIYANEENRVIALRLYLKSDRETIADQVILDAFNAAADPPDESA